MFLGHAPRFDRFPAVNLQLLLWLAGFGLAGASACPDGAGLSNFPQ
jgi:hypothetical protein